MKPEVKEFYRKQNELIVQLMNADQLHSVRHTYGTITGEDLEKVRSRKVKTRYARENRTKSPTTLTYNATTPTRTDSSRAPLAHAHAHARTRTDNTHSHSR